MNREIDSRALVLPRRRLIETLAASAAAFPLTVVAAPMGYGKTIAARALAGAWNGASAFLDIPPGLRDGRRLWRALAAELERRGLVRPGGLDRLPELPRTPGEVGNLLDALPPDAGRALVVLDGCQHARDAGVNAFFSALARLSPPGLGLAIFSRSWPRIRLDEMAADGRAALFGEERLRFSESETAEYFALHGVRDADAAKRAWEYGEGWPALVWHSLDRLLGAGKARRLRDLEATLVKSALSGFSAADRAALRRLSVMDDFSAEEAAALAGRKVAAIEASPGKRNAAIFHDGKTGRFRFHRLVGNHLSEELSAARNVNLSGLHRRAAECHVGRGDSVAAIRLFLRAGDDRSLEAAFNLFLAPGAERIVRLLPDETRNAIHSLPSGVRAENIMGYLAFLRLSLAAGRDARDATWRLAEVESALSENGGASPDSRRAVEGEIALTQGLLASHDAGISLERHARAHSLLRGPSGIHPRLLSWSLGCPSPSFAWLRDPGTFDALADAAAAAEKHLAALSDGHGRDCAGVLRMEYRLERGEFRKAKRLLRDFEAGGDDPGRLSAAIMAGFVKSRLLLVEGGGDMAARTLADLSPRIAGSNPPHHSESLELALAYLNAVLGRHDLVPEWIRRGDIFSPPHGLAQRSAFLFILYGKTLLAARDYERLAAFSGSTPPSPILRDSLLGRIHKGAIEAICRYRLEGEGAALEILREAFELSRPDGLVLPLAEYGGEILPLLRSLKKADGGNKRLNRVISVAESVRRGVSAGVPGPRNRDSLSRREHEVMRMVSRGMTNAAIGEELGITRNGIAKCLGAIYAKLGASNRTRASELYQAPQK